MNANDENWSIKPIVLLGVVISGSRLLEVGARCHVNTLSTTLDIRGANVPEEPVGEFPRQARPPRDLCVNWRGAMPSPISDSSS